MINSGMAQPNYNDTIPGPYEDHPGPYYIRTYVNFQQAPNDMWTTNWDVHAEAEAAMTTLNAAFNEHNIYFVPYGDPCGGAAYQVHTTNLNTLEIRAQLQSQTVLDGALHIYVLHDDGNVGGWEFNTPNNFCQVYGKRDGVLATGTEILVHEVGHNLGLVHTFINGNNGGCDEEPGSCSPDEPCNCCGDYVCDTEPHSDAAINASSNCEHATLPEHIVRNFMSYTTPGGCRNHFTPEQAKRMRTYLESASVLQSCQIKTVNAPTGLVSGNILVDPGELHITSTLEMLPGAYIWVKPGATLRVSAKITGACGKLWRGVIVQGDDLPQVPANQGRVIVDNNGVVEHAVCGIDAGGAGEGGTPLLSPGGGIVNVTGGTFINNIISIRFGPYLGANVSNIFFGNFYTDDDYRSNIPPFHMEINNIP